MASLKTLPAGEIGGHGDTGLIASAKDGLMKQRESLNSRIGFLLLSAGCAIGLGNVWRFPFITGSYGGAAFVFIYLIFLIILGLPVLIMEFSVGRAAQRGVGHAFRLLEPAGTKWHLAGYMGVIGCFLLMMFYTTITGWMLSYCWYALRGSLSGLTPEQIGQFFTSTLLDPYSMAGWMGLAVLIGTLVCMAGLRRGVERVTKIMMACLFLIILILVVRAVTLPGAQEGIRFYLMPNLDHLFEQGVGTVVFAAMGQAFFTLSVGIGSMAIFGSYIGKERSLTGEALGILGMDTMVALLAGLLIFPACSAFGVSVNSGPGLVFVTLPNVFNSMPGGEIWCMLFFVFMSFAALTTVIAVMEGIIAYPMDGWGWSRRKAASIVGILLFFASLPCVPGFNVWSDIQPLGQGSGILDFEDFIVSNNLLPLGSLIFVLFCCSRCGWGWDKFIREANSGKGLRFPEKTRFYITYILPCIILYVFVQGYINKFFM